MKNIRTTRVPRRPSRFAAVLAASLALSMATVAPAAASPDTTTTTVYNDSLARGWSDWSWGSSVQIPAAQPGEDVIQWRSNQPWGGLYLHTDDSLASAGSTLHFDVRAREAGSRLSVGVYGEDARRIGGRYFAPNAPQTLAPEVWRSFQVPLSDLVSDGRRITGLTFQDATGAGRQMELDNIRIVGAATSQRAAVARYPEIRPDNGQPNATRGRATEPGSFFGHEGFRPYYARVNGDFTGTTEEILEWAAAKWGMDELGYPDLAKSVAVIETWWSQGFRGDVGELGLLQVNPAAWPDAQPAAWSTAYSADYGMAVLRHHYDGQSWLGAATAGNLRNSVAAYECGCARSGNNYAQRVFDANDSKVWRRPGVAPDWF